jgi:hypothetical protein
MVDVVVVDVVMVVDVVVVDVVVIVESVLALQQAHCSFTKSIVLGLVHESSYTQLPLGY